MLKDYYKDKQHWHDDYIHRVINTCSDYFSYSMMSQSIINWCQHITPFIDKHQMFSLCHRFLDEWKHVRSLIGFYLIDKFQLFMLCHTRCCNQPMIRCVSVNDEFSTTSLDEFCSDITRRVLLKKLRSCFLTNWNDKDDNWVFTAAQMKCELTHAIGLKID